MPGLAARPLSKLLVLRLGSHVNIDRVPERIQFERLCESVFPRQGFDSSDEIALTASSPASPKSFFPCQRLRSRTVYQHGGPCSKQCLSLLFRKRIRNNVQ